MIQYFEKEIIKLLCQLLVLHILKVLWVLSIVGMLACLLYFLHTAILRAAIS